jgi:hypothetical protein
MASFQEDLASFVNSDPTLRALFTPARQPRYRYWQSPDGAMFFWTTETLAEGKYASGIYQPYGPGARSGTAKVTQWKPVRVVEHSTRKAARARALRLWTAADKAHPEWSAAREDRRQARNDAVRLRYYRRTGKWLEQWGPVPEGE